MAATKLHRFDVPTVARPIPAPTARICHGLEARKGSGQGSRAARRLSRDCLNAAKRCEFEQLSEAVALGVPTRWKGWPSSRCVRNGRTVLAVRVLQENFAVPKSEQITAVSFDTGSVRPCSRERPLRYAPVSMDKVARVPPVGIGKDSPDLRVTRSYGFSACVPGSADVSAGRGLKDTVLRHERHERIDIVAIPCVGKGLQNVRGYFRNYRLHDGHLHSHYSLPHPSASGAGVGQA